MAESTKSTTSIITLPKGGGALHGIGEKFSPDMFTGTGNFTVPIALPTGRNGFQPQLSLVYSTGQGNGAFGLGWGLSIPGITRQTAKGIPRYDDAEDIFILSGAEDLVPVKEIGQNGYTPYRPRTEGLFARIRHFRSPDKNYWKVQTKDGLTSIYGSEDPDENATCADPARPSKIFAWKLTKTRDPFDNEIIYGYERDWQQEGPRHWDQLYLQEIKYVDFEAGGGLKKDYLVRVKFIYQENRPDSFSEYKSGFEIRTRKRCEKILVETWREEVGDYRGVRTYYFHYDNDSSLNRISLLAAVSVSGFDDVGNEITEMPPLEFGYSRFDPLAKRDFFPIMGNDLPPVSLGNPDYELADLSGNGLPDVLQLNGTARYWKNLGDGRFDLPRTLKDRPPVSLSDAGVQMLDADGDGRIDLLVTNGTFSGYYTMEHGRDAEWSRRPFYKFPLAPSFDLKDPEVRLVDLTGDGVTDVVRSGSRLECFFNDPVKGWEKTRWVPRKSSLEEFPNVQFSDPRVKWADMTGDTMQDIVLVYDGNVEYWPNLGHGQWGKRIHMKNSPRFRDAGYTFRYDPRRILLGDVDGDGLADIVYVEDRQITLWINQSGNSWSDPIVIQGTPPVSDLDSVRLVDLKGSGVAGILWSKDVDRSGRPNMFFLDLTGGGKPYLLQEMDNHIGSTTRVRYASSSEFYLQDEKERRHRWQTSLPFPVQVVKQVEVIDHISQTKLTTAYRYHHGYWDGVEREFRGFGMVEQMDTLTASDFNKPNLHGPDTSFQKVEGRKFSPPLLTKTWFHQGPIRRKEGQWIEADYSREYWEGDAGFFDKGQMLKSVLSSSALKPHEKRDALRALRGSILRTEVYAQDGTVRAGQPYTVTESRYDIREEAVPNADELQKDRKRIFFPFAVSQRTTQWERGEEPMTQFVFTGEYDAFGQPRQQTQIACYRGWKKPEEDGTKTYLATRSRTVYAAPQDLNDFIHNRVAGVTSWEVKNTQNKTVLEIAALKDGESMEVFNHTITFYDGDAYKGLAWETAGKYGAAVRTETLVLTDDILTKAYTHLYENGAPAYFSKDKPVNWPREYPVDFQNAAQQLGYHWHDGTDGVHLRGYYVIAERKKLDFQMTNAGAQGLVHSLLDPMAWDINLTLPFDGHITEVAYDKFGLMPVKVTQKLSGYQPGLSMEAEYNYRVLQPWKVTDPNGNITRFKYAPLGLLTATWQSGKSNKEGDQSRPGSRLEYDFQNFRNTGDPIWVKTIQHIHHDTETDVPLPKLDETICTVEYSDGFGRMVQTRIQAEEVLFGDVFFGNDVLTADQKDLVVTKKVVPQRINTDENNPNVVVSGWQIYDNKGQVIEKFEPFYSTGWDYKNPDEERDEQSQPLAGKSIRMEYDPRGQVIRTINPDDSEQRVIYGIPNTLDTPDDFTPTPWEAYTYDANDLAPLTHGNTAETQKFQGHWFTPAHIEIDGLGRTIKAVQREKQSQHPKDWIVTTTRYDIRGNALEIRDAYDRQAFLHAYDLANQPLLIKSIDAGIRTTIYNALGNPIERRDKRGGLILQAYDDLSRPTKKWARDNESGSLTLREKMIYGESLGQTAATADNKLGKLHQHHDEAGILTVNAYDFKGNMLEKQRETVADTPILAALVRNTPFTVDWEHPPTLETPAFVTTVSYDALNRVKKMNYPQDVSGSRKVLVPEYNRAGALEKVTFDDEVYVEHIAYNAKGQRSLILYGNRLMTRYAYDPLTFRLLRLRTEKYEDAPGGYKPLNGTIQDFGYSYDLVGNIESINDTAKGSGTGALPDELKRLFTYDAIYRLISATGRECDIAPPNRGKSEIAGWLQMKTHDDPTKTRAYQQTYYYDKMGNMERLQHRAGRNNSYNKRYRVEKDSNRLEKAIFRRQPFEYLYDANGNLEQESLSRHHQWDHSDRLIRFSVDDAHGGISQQAAYLYDAGGMRVKKFVLKGGTWESRTYIDGIFEYTENDAGDTNNHLHVMDDQSRIAIRRIGHDMGDNWPAVQYHLGDHLGSSNVVIGGSSASGSTMVTKEEYYPYGQTSFGDYAKKRYRYSGKERDEESGLYYYGARYYAGWLGRWVSCDPAGNIDGTNLFLFSKNNPFTFRDLDGFKADNSSSTSSSTAQSSNEDRLHNARAEFIKGLGASLTEKGLSNLINNLTSGSFSTLSRLTGSNSIDVGDYDRGDRGEDSWNPLERALNEFSVADDFAGKGFDLLVAGKDEQALKAFGNAGYWYGKFISSSIDFASLVAGGTQLGIQSSRKGLEKLSELVGNLPRNVSGARLNWTDHLKRFFVQDTSTHPGVGSSWGGKFIKWLFPSVKWEQGHIVIQRSWFRVNGPNQSFPNNTLANSGLKRLGDAGWNLLPLPRKLNRIAGENNLRGKLLTGAIAITVYGGLAAWTYGTIIVPVENLYQSLNH